MTSHSRRIAAAALIAVMAAGGTAAFAGEGGQHSAQRARLKAEWAEFRAQQAAHPDASFVERLFGFGGKDEKVAAAPVTGPATGPANPEPKKN